MSKTIGLYLHIPFCKSKCAYCDFFSGAADGVEREEYVEELRKKIILWGDTVTERVSSVYFGGGTPGLLGSKALCGLTKEVKSAFVVDENAEITVELNPESGRDMDFEMLRASGFNRISAGLQSSDETELKALGRIHSPQEAAETVRNARRAGFENISLDLMLGIPFQTKESLRRSIDFCAELEVKHISCYLLKIEKGTRFYSLKERLPFPDDDTQADFYLFAAAQLERLGYRQYEISNFALPSYESRHNTLYWSCGEYIGIGPSAHSFYRGRRFYYPRDFQSFYENRTVDDGEGGGEDEYIMLALRLKRGVVFREYEERFQKPFPASAIEKARLYEKMGLMEVRGDGFGFTPQGFLVSNTVIGDLLGTFCPE